MMRILILGMGWVAGCTSDGPATYTGALPDSDAVLGLSLEDDRGLVYVCGGPQSMAEHHHWVGLTPDGEGWSGASEGRAITLDPDGDGWSGTLEIGDDRHDFLLQPAAGLDGPWEAETDIGDCSVGAVVVDGESRMQGVFCDGPLFAQVIPVGVLSPSDGALAVEADIDPPVGFQVIPAVP